MQVKQRLGCSSAAYVDSYCRHHLTKLPQYYIRDVIRSKLPQDKAFFRAYVEEGQVFAAAITLLHSPQEAADLVSGGHPVYWHAFSYSGLLSRETLSCPRPDVHLEVVQLSLSQVMLPALASLHHCKNCII